MSILCITSLLYSILIFLHWHIVEHQLDNKMLKENQSLSSARKCWFILSLSSSIVWPSFPHLPFATLTINFCLLSMTSLLLYWPLSIVYILVAFHCFLCHICAKTCKSKNIFFTPTPPRPQSIPLDICDLYLLGLDQCIPEKQYGGFLYIYILKLC